MVEVLQSTLQVPEGSQSQNVFPHTLGQLGIIRPCVLIFLSETVTSHSSGLMVASLLNSSSANGTRNVKGQRGGRKRVGEKGEQGGRRRVSGFQNEVKGIRDEAE